MITVSVLMITYNHEKYIGQAIDGILNQVGNFNLELIIADDKSPDNTEMVINKIAENHPKGNSIHYTKHVDNKGMQENFVWATKQCTGKYIALCEGDDYWIDPNKLQRQVSFLEEHQGFSSCFHAVKVKNEISGVNYQYSKPRKNVLNFNDLLLKHYIPTCSFLFLKDAMPNPLPKWYSECLMGDIPLELLIADHGLSKFFNEEMAVYRKNHGGITLNSVQILKGRQAYIFIYSSLRKYFKGKYFFSLSLILFKMRLGYIRDLLGLNPLLK